MLMRGTHKVERQAEGKPWETVETRCFFMGDNGTVRAWSVVDGSYLSSTFAQVRLDLQWAASHVEGH